MLARALYKGASILLLDEPTAALDPIAENDIYQKYSAMTAGKQLRLHQPPAGLYPLLRPRSSSWSTGGSPEEGTHEELLRTGRRLRRRSSQMQSRYYQEGGATHAAESREAQPLCLRVRSWTLNTSGLGDLPRSGRRGHFLVRVALRSLGEGR